MPNNRNFRMVESADLLCIFPMGANASHFIDAAIKDLMSFLHLIYLPYQLSRPNLDLLIVTGNPNLACTLLQLTRRMICCAYAL